MECCGVPFKIGDTVFWYVINGKGIKPTIDIDEMDYYYEAHSDSDDDNDLLILKGIIKDISICYNKYDLVKGEHHNMLVPVKGTTKLIKTDNSEVKDEYLDGLRASGYIIDLEEINVRPAKEE